MLVGPPGAQLALGGPPPPPPQPLTLPLTLPPTPPPPLPITLTLQTAALQQQLQQQMQQQHRHLLSSGEIEVVEPAGSELDEAEMRRELLNDVSC